jgi:hypothetical protein
LAIIGAGYSKAKLGGKETVKLFFGTASVSMTTLIFEIEPAWKERAAFLKITQT